MEDPLLGLRLRDRRAFFCVSRVPLLILLMTELDVDTITCLMASFCFFERAPAGTCEELQSLDSLACRTEAGYGMAEVLYLVLMPFGPESSTGFSSGTPLIRIRGPEILCFSLPIAGGWYCGGVSGGFSKCSNSKPRHFTPRAMATENITLNRMEALDTRCFLAVPVNLICK